MRCCIALQTCLTLVLALLLAPFQHVHTGPDHEHDGVVHAHFYHILKPALALWGGQSWPQAPFQAASEERSKSLNPPDADDDDDHANVRSLDTFALAIPIGLPPFALSRGPEIAFVAIESSPRPAAIEERGNGPPTLDRSTPRAPPV